MEHKVMSLRLLKAMHDKLREIAYKRDVSMGKIIREALQKELQSLAEKEKETP